MDGLSPITQLLKILGENCVLELVMEAILNISKSSLDDCLLEDLIEDVDKDKVKDVGVLCYALLTNKAADHEFLKRTLINEVHGDFLIEKLRLLLFLMDHVQVGIAILAY